MILIIAGYSREAEDVRCQLHNVQESVDNLEPAFRSQLHNLQNDVSALCTAVCSLKDSVVSLSVANPKNIRRESCQRSHSAKCSVTACCKGSDNSGRPCYDEVFAGEDIFAAVMRDAVGDAIPTDDELTVNDCTADGADNVNEILQPKCHVDKTILFSNQVTPQSPTVAADHQGNRSSTTSA